MPVRSTIWARVRPAKFLDTAFSIPASESDRGVAGLWVSSSGTRLIKNYWQAQFRTVDVIARMTGMPRTFGLTANVKF